MTSTASTRTDVYLLGAKLREVLTRLPRHQGTNLHERDLSVEANELRVFMPRRNA